MSLESRPQRQGREDDERCADYGLIRMRLYFALSTDIRRRITKVKLLIRIVHGHRSVHIDISAAKYIAI